MNKPKEISNTPTQKPTKLTPKQRHFVQEYIKTGNGTQAAHKAYDANYDTAHAIATENLQKPSIKDAIEKALAILEITPEWILKSHKDIAENNRIINPNAAERALENIGKIADLYPKTDTNIDINKDGIKISWQE